MNSRKVAFQLEIELFKQEICYMVNVGLFGKLPPFQLLKFDDQYLQQPLQYGVLPVLRFPFRFAKKLNNQSLEYLSIARSPLQEGVNRDVAEQIAFV